MSRGVHSMSLKMTTTTEGSVFKPRNVSELLVIVLFSAFLLLTIVTFKLRYSSCRYQC